MRLATALVLSAVLGAGVLLGAPAAGAGQDPDPDEAAARPVNVVEATGRLDPVLVDFLTDRIAEAAQGSEVVVIVLDSPGVVVGDDRLEDLLRAMRSSPVPVTVWVGPSGAQAGGDAAQLVLGAAVSGMSPRSRLGPVQEGDGPAGRRTGNLDAEEALGAGLIDLGPEDAPVLGDFVTALDERRVGQRRLDTAQVVGEGAERRRQPQNVTFAKLPFVARTLHGVASPPVAYLLLTAALGLLVFELFTAGVGVAGGVGAASGVLAAYGLAVLPTSPLGLGLLVLATFGFAVDVQTGSPRFWTGVGALAYAIGSFTLFPATFRPGWLPLLAGTGGMVLVMLVGLPATVRSRFSTPTIGRESMIGELGDAMGDLRPNGLVSVRQAQWRARTNRATPVTGGERVRVVGIEGTVLEVEPESGGARDYRDRGKASPPNP